MGKRYFPGVSHPSCAVDGQGQAKSLLWWPLRSALSRSNTIESYQLLGLPDVRSRTTWCVADPNRLSTQWINFLQRTVATIISTWRSRQSFPQRGFGQNSMLVLVRTQTAVRLSHHYCLDGCWTLVRCACTSAAQKSVAITQLLVTAGVVLASSRQRRHYTPNSCVRYRYRKCRRRCKTLSR